MLERFPHAFAREDGHPWKEGHLEKYIRFFYLSTLIRSVYRKRRGGKQRPMLMSVYVLIEVDLPHGTGATIIVVSRGSRWVARNDLAHNCRSALFAEDKVLSKHQQTILLEDMPMPTIMGKVEDMYESTPTSEEYANSVETKGSDQQRTASVGDKSRKWSSIGSYDSHMDL